MIGPGDPERTVYLVDGTSHIFRAFYAIRRLSTRAGLPTNAVYGFTTMLRKLLKERVPRYLAVAFDLGEPTFRHRAFADYKAHRPEPPSDLIAQVPHVKRVCGALRVATIEQAGYEADDLIATLAGHARQAGFEVVIVASDKDLLQLVREGVLVYHPVREEYLDGDGVEQVFGVRPEQVRDVLALCGDASDNIPGVSGIGEKGAKDLIRRFGDLEAVLRAAATIERKSYREGLLAEAQVARLSRDLATLRADAPVPFDPESLRVRPPDEASLAALFRELEFTGLLKEMGGPGAPGGEPESGGGPMVSATAASSGEPGVVLDGTALERAIAALRAEGISAIKLERDHPEPMRARLVGLTLAGPRSGAFYVPLGHAGLGTPRQMRQDAALALLRPLLDDAAVRRVGHDVKSDRVLLRRDGIATGAFHFDTMIASYLLDPSRTSHALENVAREAGGVEVPSWDAILGTGAKRQPLADLSVDRAAAVAGARAAAVLAIRGGLEERLRRAGLDGMFTGLEMPLAEVLSGMEATGVRIDTAFLQSLSSAWEADLSRLTAAIHDKAGRVFNINSPRQLGEVLFDTLKLKPGRRTEKTRSFSTGVEVLEDLAREHEVPRLILEYRAVQKLKSTYVDALPALVNPGTGRVHTSFNQTVAATGRLSSSDPNLQNIPVRTAQGRQIRRAFIPADGCLLLSADYSQVELRVLAHLCGDEALVEAFRSGEDVHRRTAAEVFGVLPGLVSDAMRRRAKAVNFGIIYGMGPQRLARDQGLTPKEAAAFIERYFQRFPKVKRYIDATVTAAEADGRVRTLFGRMRPLPELRGTDRNLKQQAVRAAVNTTIQGTAADLIKMAMIALDRRLAEAACRARMILQVHDELVLEVRREEMRDVAPLVREVMEKVHALDVPLVADLRAGPNWLETDDLPGR